MPANEIHVAIYYCWTLYFKGLKVKTKHLYVSAGYLIFVLSLSNTKVLWWTLRSRYCDLVCKPLVAV